MGEIPVRDETDDDERPSNLLDGVVEQLYESIPTD